MAEAPDPAAVRHAWLALQDAICAGLEAEDGGGRFVGDPWTRAEGSGDTRVLAEGEVFEKAGVAFSHVRGLSLPPAATARRPELAGRPWQAMGISVVVHPRNPYVPTSHLNVRFFLAEPGPPKPPGEGGYEVLGGLRSRGGPPSPVGLRRAPDSPGERIWWFGGGFDLTPCYGFEEDAVFWHRAARDAVAPFGAGLYPRFKRACDEYFFLPHRREARGIGGLFFDDFDELGAADSFGLARAVGEAYLQAYRPLVARRRDAVWGERERRFQLHRRGRYAEFNLVRDRGTLFGLQSGGRAESILVSLPPLARWDYGWTAAPGSAEARLTEDFLRPRDWAGE